MNKLNFVSCVGWVPKGIPKENPKKIELTQEELKMKIEENERMLKEMEINEPMDEDAQQDNAGDDDNDAPMNNGDNGISAEDQAIIDKYNLDEYDDEGDEGGLSHGEFVMFANDKEDPLLKNDGSFSEDEEEKEDFMIKSTDNLLLCSHIEENQISLEVKIYNSEDDIYVHHEIYLGAYPTCMEHISDLGNGEKINYVAIGDMEEDINIWDLDLVDTLDPTIVLKGHRGAVLDLSWNKLKKNILASVSADKTGRLWDMGEKKELFKHEFKATAQTIQFHPEDPNILLTGDSKGKAILIDITNGSSKKWAVCKDEVEKIIWNKYNPFQFIAGTTAGNLFCFDVRNENSFVYTIDAHSEMISGLEFSSSVQGCLVSCSADKMAKIWDLKDESASCVKCYEPNVGTILSMSANPDYPFVFAFAGNNNAENWKVVNFGDFKQVQEHFTGR